MTSLKQFFSRLNQQYHLTQRYPVVTNRLAQLGKLSARAWLTVGVVALLGVGGVAAATLVQINQDVRNQAQVTSYQNCTFADNGKARCGSTHPDSCTLCDNGHSRVGVDAATYCAGQSCDPNSIYNQKQPCSDGKGGSYPDGSHQCLSFTECKVCDNGRWNGADRWDCSSTSSCYLPAPSPTRTLSPTQAVSPTQTPVPTATPTPFRYGDYCPAGSEPTDKCGPDGECVRVDTNTLICLHTSDCTRDGDKCPKPNGLGTCFTEAVPPGEPPRFQCIVISPTPSPSIAVTPTRPVFSEQCSPPEGSPCGTDNSGICQLVTGTTNIYTCRYPTPTPTSSATRFDYTKKTWVAVDGKTYYLLDKNTKCTDSSSCTFGSCQSASSTLKNLGDKFCCNPKEDATCPTVKETADGVPTPVPSRTATPVPTPASISITQTQQLKTSLSGNSSTFGAYATALGIISSWWHALTGR